MSKDTTTRPPRAVGIYSLTGRSSAAGPGDVWFARHPGRAQRVAVTLLKPRGAAAAQVRQAVHAAARDTAGLDHRHVVRVFDHGALTAAEAVTLGRGARAEDPWIATEHLDGDSLRPHLGRLLWGQMRDVLRTVLESLAHMHARGVRHLGIGPDSVRLSPRGPVLVDVGLAAALAQDPHPAPAGSWDHTAPEQFDGDWRLLGPWTDLYSVGALAWAMATGSAVFADATSLPVARRAHASRPPGRLKPPHPTPGAFEPWVRCLLEKDPRDRFQRAGDALAALQALEALDESVGRTTEEADDTMSLGHPDTAEVPGFQNVEVNLVGEPAPAAERMGAASLSMHTPPVAGREQVRSTLLGALRPCVSRMGPRTVVLRGPTGTGTSRLAAWLVEHATEHALADAIVARHGPGPAPGQGIAAALRRHFRTDGLALDDALAHLRQRLSPSSPVLTRGLAEVLMVDGPARPDRQALLADTLATLSEDKPLVVWLDDVQWAPAAVELARRLQAGNGQICTVLSVDTDALVARPDIAALLDALQSRSGVTPVELDRLPPMALARLARSVVDIDDPPLGELVAHADGSPLTLLQGLALSIERGDLRPGRKREKTRPDLARRLPTTSRDLWRARVDRLLSHADQRSLWLAACLGDIFDADEWRTASAALRAPLSPALVETLLDHRLVESMRDGPTATLRFAHPQLRDTLVEEAAGAGALPELHAACADALGDQPGPIATERRAMHLWRSGAYVQGTELLLVAAQLHRAAARTSAHARVVAQATRQSGRVELPVATLARLALERGHRCDLAGDAAGALAAFEGAAQVVARAGDTALRQDWLCGRGRMRAAVHGAAAGVPELRRSHQLAQELGDDAALAQTAHLLGAALVDAGEHAEGLILLETAWRLLLVQGQVVDAVSAGLRMVSAGAQHGDPASTKAIAERVIAAVEDHDLAWIRPDAYHALGELHRAQGAYARADRMYRRASEAAARNGVDTLTHDFGRVLVALQEGNLTMARRLHAGLGLHDDPDDAAQLVAASHLVDAVFAAHAGDPAAFDHSWAAAEGRHRDAPGHGVSIRTLAKLASAAAAAQGWTQRSTQASGLTAPQAPDRRRR